jgi:hypothetical protein
MTGLIKQGGTMRAFTLEVFEGWVVGDTVELRSAAEANDALGRARELVVHWIVEDSSGTSPALTVKVYQSNNNTAWVDTQTALNGVAVASPAQGMFNVTGPLGSFVGFGLQMGGSDQRAKVRLIVSGRA